MFRHPSIVKFLAIIVASVFVFLLPLTALADDDPDDPTCLSADMLDAPASPYAADVDGETSHGVSVAGQSTLSGLPKEFSTAIGRVEIRYKKGAALCADWCTGFLIDKDHIVTAHHCIPQYGRTILSARIRLGFDSENVDKFPGELVELDPLPVKDNSDGNSLDYSVVRIKNPPLGLTAKYGQIPLAIADPRFNEQIAVIHHPSGRPKRISAECYVLRSTLDHDFEHTCATHRGSSGAPIFSVETKKLIGIHVRRHIGIRLRSIAANSLIIQSQMKSLSGSDVFSTPLALLKGSWLILGERDALGSTPAEGGTKRAPFGRAVLQWVIDGNPLSGERLEVRYGVNVRSKHPQVGNQYGRTIVSLRPGMIVRIRSVVPILTRTPKWKDTFFWGQIEEVECGDENQGC